MTALSTNAQLTRGSEAQFFLAPDSAAQRQYEALRAFFVDQPRLPPRKAPDSPAALAEVGLMASGSPSDRARSHADAPRPRLPDQTGGAVCVCRGPAGVDLPPPRAPLGPRPGFPPSLGSVTFAAARPPRVPTGEDRSGERMPLPTVEEE
jgi:hypothetical protein